MPLRFIGPLLRSMAQSAAVPVAVHLDHAVELASIETAITCGFSSVMFDGSQLSFADNVVLTRQAIAMARPQGVSVEAEIGSVAYNDPAIPAKHIYTDPQEAKDFWEATLTDCLAVSIGTVHRMQAQTAYLQFDRLQNISQAVAVPLVIHGSTGVSDEDLARLSRCGISKINIGTCLRMAFGNALRKAVQDNPDEFDRIRLFQQPCAAVRQAAARKMRLLQSPQAQRMP